MEPVQNNGKPGQRVEFTHNIHAIYLAGKVAMYDDWREQLVAYHPDYAAALQDDPGHAHKSRYGGIVFDASGDAASPDSGREHWPVRAKALFGRYDYTGPYVSDMGHNGNLFADNIDFVRAECLDAIKRSDLVFAWLDDATAYATLAELGYAKALGKRIWIAAPLEYHDLWFVYGMADRVSFGATNPRAALLGLLAHIRQAEE